MWGIRSQEVTAGAYGGNVRVTMEMSTDLVNWAPAVNGMVYTNSPEAFLDQTRYECHSLIFLIAASVCKGAKKRSHLFCDLTGVGERLADFLSQQFPVAPPQAMDRDAHCPFAPGLAWVGNQKP